MKTEESDAVLPTDVKTGLSRKSDRIIKIMAHKLESEIRIEA